MPSALTPDAVTQRSSRLSTSLLLTERLLAGGALLVWLWFLVVLGNHAGGLWRDEVGSARLAQLPTWGQMYGSVAQDSFPPLFNTVLRLWILVGGAGDDWMHAWGLVALLGMAAALWWSTRGPVSAVPLLSGALLLFNPTVFYWGSSLRAYGLAAILVILLFGAVWQLVERPTPRAFALAIGLSILNAQATYQNASLILAVCVSAAVVAAIRGFWVRSGLALGVGLAGALSLLLHYRAIQHVQEWNVLIRQELDFSWFIGRAADAFGSAGWGLVWLWVLLAAGMGTLAIYLGVRAGKEAGQREECRASLYAFVCVVVATVALLLFNKHAGYPTQEWYYIPFMALVACALEFSLGLWLRVEKVRIARVVVAAIVVVASLSSLGQRAQVRRTNMDLLVARLKAEAIPRDLILVSPFYCGIGFQYYYRGNVPWLTIPPIPHEEVHNAYEQVKPYMMQSEPMRPVLEQVTATLRAGGRLWFVGGLRLPPEGTVPPPSPPAPHPQFGWSDEMYSQIWCLQVGHYVQTHATTARVVAVTEDQPVQKWEHLPLIEVSGWRE